MSAIDSVKSVPIHSEYSCLSQPQYWGWYFKSSHCLRLRIQPLSFWSCLWQRK